MILAKPARTLPPPHPPSSPRLDDFSAVVEAAKDQVGEGRRAVVGQPSVRPAASGGSGTAGSPPPQPDQTAPSNYDDYDDFSSPTDSPKLSSPPEPHPQGDLPPWIVAHPDGTYSIHAFDGLPEEVSRTSGPHVRTFNDAYLQARKLGDAFIGKLKRAGEVPEGHEPHHIDPIFLGGTPDDRGNIQMLPSDVHAKATSFWNRIKTHIDRHRKYIDNLKANGILNDGK